MFIKRDPGPCPVDGAPHTTCVAPGSGGAIVAGPIQTPTQIVVSPPTQHGAAVPLAEPQPAAAGNASTPPAAPDSPTFTTSTYRKKRTGA